MGIQELADDHEASSAVLGVSFSRVRDWKVLQKFGSHKGANALSKGPLLRVAGRRAQIWYCAT